MLRDPDFESIKRTKTYARLSRRAGRSPFAPSVSQ
jgi:hypothetical protein